MSCYLFRYFKRSKLRITRLQSPVRFVDLYCTSTVLIDEYSFSVSSNYYKKYFVLMIIQFIIELPKQNFTLYFCFVKIRLLRKIGQVQYFFGSLVKLYKP